MIETSLHPRQAKRGVGLGEGTNARQTYDTRRDAFRAIGGRPRDSRSVPYDDVLVEMTAGACIAGAAS
ncbi:hypothetical protein WJ00_10985 [Burkholderia vietnamiensis]|nr:hypothetical protein WJ00_10985 [Burkholderia vietnamiensis]